MTEKFDHFEVSDVRFPTSQSLDGSDAMNPDPDYSAAYLALRTSTGESGYGFVFTIGRGNEVAVAAIRAVEHLVYGLDVDDVFFRHGRLLATPHPRQPAALARPGKSVIAHGHRRGCQRRLGPLRQKARPATVEGAGRPYPHSGRRADRLSPPQRCSHGRREALDLLTRALPGKHEREQRLLSEGYPAYTTSAAGSGTQTTRSWLSWRRHLRTVSPISS